MMQSAPIRRIAVTVFSRCCATSVSTVGTPVMSIMAIEEPVSTILCSRVSITVCVRALSSVPIIGSARTPVPQLDDRRGQLQQFLLLATDDLFPGLLVGVERMHSEAVD